MKSTKQNAPLFDERDFAEMKKLGISEEEIETLQNADAIKQTVDMLPAEKDMAKFMAKVRQQFAGKDTGKEIMEFLALAEKNPEYFLQIFALFEVLDIHDNEAPEVKIEKIQNSDLDAQNKEILKESVKDFLEVYKTLNADEKKLFLEKIKSGK